MKLRNGSTLIEVMLSMTAGSAVLLLAISLVHQTMSITQICRHRADHQRTLDQLAHSFRRDIHLASSVELADNSTFAILCEDGSQITYSEIDHIITRERRRNSEATEKEKFALAPHSKTLFTVKQDPHRMGLEVRSSTGIADKSTKLELAVEACLGRWRTIEKAIQVSQ